MRCGDRLHHCFDTGGDVQVTVMAIADITAAVLTGFGTALLVTVPVVMCGYVFRALHIIS